MDNILQEIVNELKEEIAEKQKTIEFVQNINLSKPLTPKIWHKICKTSAKTNYTLLSILISNTFPGADDIRVRPNYNHVYFNLYGIDCVLPLSTKTDRICIDTGWYDECDEEPILCETIYEHNKRQYFAAKDKKEHWEKLFDLRFPWLTTYPKLLKCIMWFGYYRWKDDCRKGWEARFAEIDKLFEEEKEEFEQVRKEMKEKTRIMVEKVIPELKKYSDNVCAVMSYDLQPDEIAKREGF